MRPKFPERNTNIMGIFSEIVQIMADALSDTIEQALGESRQAQGRELHDRSDDFLLDQPRRELRTPYPDDPQAREAFATYVQRMHKAAREGARDIQDMFDEAQRRGQPPRKRPGNRL